MAAKVQEALVILRRKQVEARAGLSRSSIYAAIKAGTFPAPVSLGEKSVGWLQHEIDGWIPASLSGSDCTKCKHLTTRQMASDGGRRQFHWACGLGYLILETGRGTERIWIAPPECESWERWIPGKQVNGHIVYKSELMTNDRK